MRSPAKISIGELSFLSATKITFCVGLLIYSFPALSTLESPGTLSPLPFLILVTTTKVEILSPLRFAVIVAKPCLIPLTSPVRGSTWAISGLPEDQRISLTGRPLESVAVKAI
ncbi:MAG: hypothetical protein FD167_126 [bacterium]|nr:MAG: hypothetical protein FD167_126 [bacterium]